MRVAIVLFNLGGPDRPESIQPFLYNFFCDKNIIALPNPFRKILAKFISTRRARRVATEIYAHMGGGSPLLENTQAQAEDLEQELGEGYRVFVSMRYWHPMREEVIEKVRDYAPDKIILLPLYPQFSQTTSGSSIDDWKEAGLDIPTSEICCYPEMEGFIQASVENIKSELLKTDQPVRLLFSAHGLPEKNIKAGDPYQYQCERTAQRIAEALEIENLDWAICYQSRVGPLKWISPSVEEELERAGQDNVGVVIYPHAFVSEHAETLVELDIEYRELAEKLNIPFYRRAQTVGTHPVFIQALGNLVRKEDNEKICPKEFGKCPCIKRG